MIKVLVVADNRRFIKKICDSFCDYKEISLTLVYHSTNAFNMFISDKPDIVIVHSQIMLPIESLLTEFAQCMWSYRVLVLGTVAGVEKWDNANISFLDDTDICRLGAIALEHKRNIPEPDEKRCEEVDYRRENYIIEPALYYIILSKYLGKDIVISEEGKCALEKHMESVGIPEIFTICGQDLIIVLKKTDVKVSKALVKIHDMIRYYISPDYSSVYAEEIYWNEVNITCENLLDNMRYTYFLLGECRAMDLLQKREVFSSFQDNYEKIVRLLIETLNGDKEVLRDMIKQVYLNDIKGHLDFNLLMSLRQGIQFGKALFVSILGRENSGIELGGNSVEDEYNIIDKYLIETAGKLSLIKLSTLVVNAIVYSFQYYKDELSLEKMADILCVSKMHLSRVFKAQTNMTFLEFLQALRIFVAKQYLCEDTYRINEISEMVGYADSHYFSKIFRKYAGCTPREFRASHIGRDMNAGINKR